MKLELYILAALIFITTSCKPQNTANVDKETSKKSYTNPMTTRTGETLHFGDPFVYEHEEVYYLTGTTNLPDGQGFSYYISTDLISWEYRGDLYRRPDNHIGLDSFWAPEVKYYRDKFYMTYSCRVEREGREILLTCLAVSDYPAGPFLDLYTPWVDLGYSVIDANIFVDDDKTPYLYFSKNGGDGALSVGENYVVKLKEDLSGIVGEPILIGKADQEWEKVAWETNRCNEGPYVFKKNGTYYMTYSANNTGYEFYGVGVATAYSPLGPWRKYADNPLMTTDLSLDISSPGHNSIVTAPDGSMYIVYHRHANANANKPDWNRVVCMDKLEIDKHGKLRIVGPTNSVQKVGW